MSTHLHASYCTSIAINKFLFIAVEDMVAILGEERKEVRLGERRLWVKVMTEGSNKGGLVETMEIG